MASEWYYTHDNARLGPVSSKDLQVLAQSGGLVPGDYVWKKGMDHWRPAVKVKGLFAKPPTVEPPDGVIGNYRDATKTLATLTTRSPQTTRDVGRSSGASGTQTSVRATTASVPGRS